MVRLPAMGGSLRAGFVLLVLSLAVLTCAAPAAQAISVTVSPRETIYDYDTQRCQDFDWPDIPVRAFRDSLNRIQLVTGQGVRPNNRMIGPDFDNLVRDCTPLLTDSNNPLPSEYDDSEWLSGIYTPDGQVVYALVHSEYHGLAHPGYCGDDFAECRYNSITSAQSLNRGDSYFQAPAPGHLVAAMPYRSVPGDGRYGYFSPSNIVVKDGWFYNMILVSATYRKQQAGVCLMRTQNLADPKSWRAWDGQGFTVRFIDPYRDSARSVDRHVCQVLSPDELGDVNRSVVWSTYLNKWIVAGTSTIYQAAYGTLLRSFYFSTSDDLIHWTPRQLLMHVENDATYQCGDLDPAAYPSFVDPDSTDRNFQTIDQTTHLYFTTFRRENCMPTSKRDLKRVEIQFSQ
jgi:hypothetical protein